ncbi:MAG: hypothetical protein IIZ07_06300 [Ruminococcus sp.]|nr:hypothetical protein [Ruminococcus sp.]
MNKIIKALSVCAVIGIMAAASVCLSGCEPSGCEPDESIITSDEGFTKVPFRYENICYQTVIVYDNKTHVMYAISSAGVATPLYNADGSLRVYGEK